MAGKDAEIRIDTTGFSTGISDSSSQCDWDAVLYSVELRDIFLLFPHPKMAHIVPKRAFPAEDVPVLSAFLRQRLRRRAPMSPLMRAGLYSLAMLVMFGGWRLYSS